MEKPIAIAVGVALVCFIWHLTPSAEESKTEEAMGLCVSKRNDTGNDTEQGKADTTKRSVKDIGREWVELEEGDICPAGCEFSMDFSSGKNFARRLPK